MVVGRDGRDSSPALAAALMRGLTEGGADVLDLGLCGTEEVYFATAHYGADGGIEVTASHNPIDYNGMKLVKAGAAPLDPATELAELARLAQAGDPGAQAALHRLTAPEEMGQLFKVLAFWAPQAPVPPGFEALEPNADRA